LKAGTYVEVGKPYAASVLASGGPADSPKRRILP
jgi:hypothetical protein